MNIVSRAVILAVISILLSAFSIPTVSAQTSVSKSPAVPFQAAGDVGGGVLVPGTLFPPTTHGHGILKRGEDWVQVQINTSGLPAGAYSVWWVIFNNPGACEGHCDMGDLFNPDVQVSIFSATGAVVKANGIGNFADRYTVGDSLGEPGKQHILGDGTLDPMKAEIHSVIKYHGPASDDPDVLHEQLYTLLGSCGENANALDLGDPFGVQCFDPQVVVHRPPSQ
jgi:hypothetical protein